MECWNYLMDQNREKMEKDIARLNKKATKLGIDARIEVKFGTPFERTRRMYIGQDPMDPDKAMYRTWVIQCYPIVIIGDEIGFPGWDIVARLEREGDMNLIFSVNDEPLPEKYRNSDFYCEHCGYTRRRNEVFVVRNTETNEYKQVGRQCLKDFLGFNNAAAVARHYAGIVEWVTRATGGDEGDTFDDFYGGCRGETLVDIHEFLDKAARIAKMYGFVSGSAAYNSFDLISTGQHTWEVFDHDPKFVPQVVKDLEQWNVEHEDFDVQTDEILTWVGEQIDKSGDDFWHNMNAMLTSGTVRYKTKGYVACLPKLWAAAMDKEVTRAAKAREGASSTFQGEIKKRQEWTLTYVGEIASFETQFGTQYIEKFLDEAGNIFIWKTSSPKDFPVGEAVTVKATVKEHKDYNGTQQTVITRVTEVANAA